MDERYLLLETRPVKVLLVEDDEVDQMAVKRAFKRAGIENEMIIANDGVEALEFLRGDAAEGFSAPFIILLDLNMPRMGGLEFLKELRQDPHLNRSIVFVLTTSDDETDIAAAYDANVAGYIVKSRVGESFKDLVSVLRPYWNLVRFPSS